MTQLHEVQQPIINLPYLEPAKYYDIKPGKPAVLVTGRRPAMYYYRPPQKQVAKGPADEPGTAISLELVNEIRSRIAEWRNAGYPGVSRTTLELLNYWQSPVRARNTKLFFCQREAAETIIFLKEARQDILQGLNIPPDDPGESGKEKGYTTFQRYATKMATGTGKTTVMAMLAAWSILNKVHNRQDARYSDVVLIICPTVTIKDRLGELDPELGDQSLFRTRDIVPAHLMKDLRQGHVLVTNWHIMELKEMNFVGKDSARVVHTGVPKIIPVTKKVDGTNKVVAETHYYESDTAFVRRIGQQLGYALDKKQNILIFNDEAHHAYRLRAEEEKESPQLSLLEEMKAEKKEDSGDEFEDYEKKEATIWIDGLDRINKLCGINFCVDLTATPYYINQTGNEAGRPFPWIISDFGLVDAIESGIVKIPQLPVQDPTGKDIPAYFHVWKWIIEEKLTPAEKGGKRGQVSPKAVVKYGQMPIDQMAGLWRVTFKEWSKEPLIHPTPPVFVIVCRDTRLAKELYSWIGEGHSDTAPPIKEFVNRDGFEYTIRIDSKVIEEIESGEVSGGKKTEIERLRFVLKTIGKTSWPNNKPPEDWIELAKKLNTDPLTPPGRDVRCIISVSMLTEGWDATTVTHIIGLRPFTSQLLCEQVVGRGLRRSRYEVLDVEDVNQIPEETAKVYGVPFEVIPFKANPNGPAAPPPKIHHVHHIPEKLDLRIEFPRVEGYSFVISSKLDIDWQRMPALVIDPTQIPDETTTKGLSWIKEGKPTLYGPGSLQQDKLDFWRGTHRRQELEYELALVVAETFSGTEICHIPIHKLFPQALKAVQRFLSEKVQLKGHADIRDVFAQPYYGWSVKNIIDAVKPAETEGEVPEKPLYERGRGPGSTSDVDFWTSREVREVSKSHVNCVVADTKKWEQSAAYYLDNSPLVRSFVKNEGIGFAIKYQFDGQTHDYVPDFLVRLQKDDKELGTLILETKGFDPKEGNKKGAAERWVKAVNYDGQYGSWAYRITHDPARVPFFLEDAARELDGC